MKNELFPFQVKAVRDLRDRTVMALDSYQRYHIPQVVSLQAPTGSGKTIIMTALIEDIYDGTEQYPEQPEAIFVWLSDSPALNEQSRMKIVQKADHIRPYQCVTISDESFDQEMLDDGYIYFLNTQKLGKGGRLSYHSDARQYTIWETLENTKNNKSDRLYFIIDEAHRGAQGNEAGRATSIMQRFIKGSSAFKISPMPLVIGMSATAARFNKLVSGTTSSMTQVIITPNDVRASGLLKDRIVLTYPEDPTKNSDMAVLQAAADEWQMKCKHWYQYTYEQHYANVNPVFVVQVAKGSGKRVSDTDLDEVVAKIEERIGKRFEANEVVHTFGSTGTLKLNGLDVPHIEPSEITENRKIKLVLFKENLSTGWDCPRAETMMSFRHAEDTTYIAQLLGRMIRTPLQCHIIVDDYLNDVRLYLPYFNRDTVKDVVDELQNTEGGEIPTVIDDESLENQVYHTYTVHTKTPKNTEPDPDQPSLNFIQETPIDEPKPLQEIHPQTQPLPVIKVPVKPTLEQPGENPKTEPIQFTLPKTTLNREDVIKFINQQGFLTYIVRDVKVNSYLKSLLSLAGLLTRYDIYRKANDEVKQEITNMMHKYIQELHQNGKYEELSRDVLEMKLSVQTFDVFGEKIQKIYAGNFVTMSDTDLDRQLRAADTKLGSYGLPNEYGRRFADEDDLTSYKIDSILYAADEECMRKLNQYAENKFHTFNDEYRKYIVNKSELCRKQYSDIIKDGDAVSEHNFILPETVTMKIDKDGLTYNDHLYADENGIAIIKLNTWEAGVLDEERTRDDFICWLRNPSRQSWSLCIPYEIEGETKATYPDFLIIRKDDTLGFVLDILEPHNPDFKDNLGKAKAFAKYADKEKHIGRIQLIRLTKDAAGKSRFVRLDMAKGNIRKKVLAAINTDELDHIFETDGVIG